MVLEGEVTEVALEEEVKGAVDAEAEDNSLARRKGEGLEENLFLDSGFGEGTRVCWCGRLGEGGPIHQRGGFGVGDVGRKEDDAVGDYLDGEVGGSLALGQDIEHLVLKAEVEIGTGSYLVEGNFVKKGGCRVAKGDFVKKGGCLRVDIGVVLEGSLCGAE